VASASPSTNKTEDPLFLFPGIVLDANLLMKILQQNQRVISFRLNRVPGQHRCTVWLPYFSWYIIPKGGKYTKLPQYIPNANKIYQMSIKYI
jgi:hypothetical protein